MRLRCLIFGHDWRTGENDDFRFRECRNCRKNQLGYTSENITKVRP